jgi:hypothetical protein
MTTNFIHAWAAMVLEQLWVYRQVNALVARSIDPELLRDRQALAEFSIRPSEPRLNPLEFHGKRRSPVPGSER